MRQVPCFDFGRTIERFDGAGVFRESDFLRISNRVSAAVRESAPCQRQGRYGAAPFARFRSPWAR